MELTGVINACLFPQTIPRPYRTGDNPTTDLLTTRVIHINTGVRFVAILQIIVITIGSVDLYWQ